MLRRASLGYAATLIGLSTLSLSAQERFFFPAPPGHSPSRATQVRTLDTAALRMDVDRPPA
jgi:hypothetical protein